MATRPDVERVGLKLRENFDLQSQGFRYGGAERKVGERRGRASSPPFNRNRIIYTGVLRLWRRVSQQVTVSAPSPFCSHGITARPTHPLAMQGHERHDHSAH